MPGATVGYMADRLQCDTANHLIDAQRLQVRDLGPLQSALRVAKT